jgi:magnesium transporter
MSGDTWIDLLDPTPEQLTNAIPEPVHATVFEHLTESPPHDDEPRPRLEAHGDYIFGLFVVPIPIRDEDRIVLQEIDVVITKDRLVTVRKTPQNGEPFSCSEAQQTALSSDCSAGMCLYHLVDEIAEQFLTIVDRLDDEIDDLEDNVELWEPVKVREHISGIRHDILHVRRVMVPTRDLARRVLDDRVDLDEQSLFPRDIEIRFADAYDKLLRATDGLDLSRDLLAGVRDYHQAQVANNQNEVMKRLTVVASVLLLPTFIVGLYGQNFKDIPELNWHFGYLWAWGLIVVTTIMQIIYFRRKRWI